MKAATEMHVCTQPGLAKHLVECPGCKIMVEIPHQCEKLGGVLRWAEL